MDIAGLLIDNNEPVIYELFAIIYHHGHSVISGHYTVDIKQKDDSWIKYDDKKTIYTQELSTDHRALSSKNAYLLFYKLKDHTIQQSPMM